MTENRRLGIFAKYWEPGKVKTRLAAELGTQSASEIYRIFVRTLVARFRQCADSRVLCFTPEEQADFDDGWIAICLATLRLDGFVSLDAGDDGEPDEHGLGRDRQQGDHKDEDGCRDPSDKGGDR